MHSGSTYHWLKVILISSWQMPFTFLRQDSIKYHQIPSTVHISFFLNVGQFLKRKMTANIFHNKGDNINRGDNINKGGHIKSIIHLDIWTHVKGKVSLIINLVFRPRFEITIQPIICCFPEPRRSFPLVLVPSFNIITINGDCRCSLALLLG